MKKRRRLKISSFQTALLGFLGVIFIGALLLMLPISTKARVETPFVNALFTSTSAVCVTGLVVYDTATYWSFFGQALILLLIQIGGMGVIMVATSIAVLSGKKLGLFGKDAMKETFSTESIGGIEHLIGFVLKGVLIVELAGALALLPAFCSRYGWRGIWLSFFHSISAFCNAGFDVMGSLEGEFSSLTVYASNPYINIVIMLLIIVGGIGFMTWEDVCKHKLHIRKYKTQSKVILWTTLFLILLPALCFFFFEFSSEPTSRRVWLSLFASVTPRTAGFNTANLSALSDFGQRITIFLMLVGGSPASTAGGIKTTTLAVLLASMVAVFRKREDVSFFRRRVANETIKKAAALLALYLMLFFVFGVAISAIEGLPVDKCLFETASAVGTVGLSMGITPMLGSVSKCFLMALMFFGRVGGLTLIYAAVGRDTIGEAKYPIDQITVG